MTRRRRQPGWLRPIPAPLVMRSQRSSRDAARDLLTQAANVIAGTVIDLAGAIGRRVLDNLLPGRRLRVSPHIVKRATSKYQARSPNISRRSRKEEGLVRHPPARSIFSRSLA
jgi:hypothetical protein